MDTPAIKKTPPNMVNAQGLSVTKLFPKIPKTPRIKAAIPPTVKINANIRIMVFKIYFDAKIGLKGPMPITKLSESVL